MNDKPTVQSKYVVKVSFTDKTNTASDGSYGQVLEWLKTIELIHPDKTIVSVSINRIIGETTFRRR